MFFGKVTVLPDRSKAELGLDPAVLSPVSDLKVYVKCTQCGEEFQRERRYLHLEHNCPKNLIRDGAWYKACNACKEYVLHTQFTANVNTNDKLDDECDECHAGPMTYGTPSGGLLTKLAVGYSFPVRFECQKLDPDAKLPARKRVSDAGHDLSSMIDGIIPPHGVVNFPTGLKVAAPPGFYYSIDGRSSLWIRGIIPFRGIIDGGYNGPLCVAMANIGDVPFEIRTGDRIAQLILHRIIDVDFVEVQSFSPEYNQRGEAGFGSTGR